jgi:hypothetical protein
MRGPDNGKKKWFYCFWIFLFLFIVGSSGWAENRWRIRINIPAYKLYLYRGTDLYRDYDIAVGKAETPSPAGDFTVAIKINNPTWYSPDHKQDPIPPGPDNPLGKFWLGLDIEGYGIHGNSAPWSIGSPISSGCFRMYNQDIEQLFNTVSVGTPVQIIYKTMIGTIDLRQQAWLELLPDIYGRENSDAVLSGTLNELGWIYRPHLKALRILIGNGKRPFKIQVPREIGIQSDIIGVDGFYWNGEIYISKDILTASQVTTMPMDGDGLFREYLEASKILNIGGLRMNWNEARNTLTIIRL